MYQVIEKIALMESQAAVQREHSNVKAVIACVAFRVTLTQ